MEERVDPANDGQGRPEEPRESVHSDLQGPRERQGIGRGTVILAVLLGVMGMIAIAVLRPVPAPAKRSEPSRTPSTVNAERLAQTVRERVEPKAKAKATRPERAEPRSIVRSRAPRPVTRRPALRIPEPEVPSLTPKGRRVETPSRHSSFDAPRPQRSGVRKVRAPVEPRKVDAALLSAGQAIHLVMESPVSSESTDGFARLRVRFAVRDLRNGRVILPQAAQVLASVVGQPSPGSDRVDLEAWLVRLSDGRSLSLRLPAGAPSGEMGVSARVSHRWGSFYGHAAILGAIGAVAEGAQTRDGALTLEESVIADFKRRSTRHSETTTRQVLERLLDRKPRYRLPVGTNVTLTVVSDLWIEL